MIFIKIVFLSLKINFVLSITADPDKMLLMVIHRQVDDGPLLVVFGSSFDPHQLKKIVRVGPPLTRLSGSAYDHC